MRDRSCESLQLSIQYLDDVSIFWKNAAYMVGLSVKDLYSIPLPMRLTWRQTVALKGLSEVAFRYQALVTPGTQYVTLDPIDAEVMWSLVDYSTISKAVEESLPSVIVPNTLDNVDSLCTDLFNVVR
jgi:hypothetical protein